MPEVKDRITVTTSGSERELSPWLLFDDSSRV
jgi:hypothetical protein